MKEIEADFDKYYTVGFRNYPVEDAYLPTGVPVKTKGRWA
jgi:formylmethanofuran dehydrogenase subunit A